MDRKFTLMQYILLLVLVPPVGAFCICTAEHVRPRFKLLSVLYCAAVLLFVLTLRMPAGRIHIDALPLN